MKHFPSTSPAQAGRSLIELLVAVAIGLVIMGSVLLISVSSVGTGDKQNAVARMNEDAAIVANIFNAHLRLAGYSPMFREPNVGSSMSVPTRNYIGPPVVGCDGGFVNAAIGPDFNNLACGGNANAPDALAVMYEANRFNTMPNGGTPTDCLGQNLAQTTVSADPSKGPYTRAENRFYVAQDNATGNRALYCAGSGNFGNPQALIDNVEDMQITYGVANVPAPGAVNVPQEPLFEPVQFLTATQVAALAPFGAPPINNWSRVVSVRICVLMRSEDNALDQATPYINCQGTPVNPPVADRRLYKTVTINTAFKNRVPPCADAIAAPGADKDNPSRCFF